MLLGTEIPWAEAILYDKNPRKGVTIEYRPIRSSLSNWEFLTPTTFRKIYGQPASTRFDFIFTYSSVEHSGLGK